MKTLRNTALALACALGSLQAGTALAQSPCRDCATVLSIREVKQKGEGTGLGAVAGGVVGGVLGHQIGSGRGNTAATIAGAGVGAYAGHQVEKNVKSTTRWDIEVRMDDGNTRRLTFENRPDVREGERVRLVDGGRRLTLIR